MAKANSRRVHAIGLLTVLVLPLPDASRADATAPSGAPWETPEYLRSGVLKQINAAGAYALGYTGAGVKVGVADTGLWTTHPEFAGRLLPGFDFVMNKPILADAPQDWDGHGTHVNGIIGAARDGTGMHGVAFNASLIPTRLGSGPSFDLDEYASAPWPFLAAHGASIVNASYALANCHDNPDRCHLSQFTRKDMEALFPKTVQRAIGTATDGVLMVVAAGNDSQADPDVLPALPHLVPELRGNWLAVVSLDPENRIAETSNRCGVARSWCLAAPGDVVYSTWRKDGYNTIGGTSQAAPVVSGVAALVKEAFPWFTAHDLQQTLLTTATDLGDPGVDKVYGWGLVNAGAAVGGYGMFTATTTLDTRGYTSTFTNDISGAGGLVKAGEGTLVLAGRNTFTGGAVVIGGTLAITGSLAAAVAVGADGTLSGTGVIAAPVAVAGRLAPGYSGPGTLTVDGPVGFSASATFAPAILGTDDADHAHLAATGTVALDGTLAPMLSTAGSAFAPALGETFTVIAADGGLSGAFAAIAQPDDLAPATRFDTLYDARTVTLVVTPHAYGHLAANGLLTSANATAVGAALDSIRPAAGTGATTARGALFARLYQVAPDALPATLTLLTGEAHASASAMAFDDARQVRGVIASRLDDAGPARGADPARPLAPGWNVMAWIAGYGGWADASGGAAARLDWTQGGALAGADVALTEETRLGVAAGAGRSSGSIDDLASSIDNDHQDVALYGASRLAGLAFRFGAAHGWNAVSTSRAIAAGPLAQTLSASYDGSTTQVFGEVSHGLTLAALQAEPFAALAYVRQSFDTFAESGGGAALTGAPTPLDTTLITLGTRLSADIAWGGGLLTPRLTLGWQHAAGDVDTGAVLRIGGSAPFLVTGTPIARDALVLDAGLSYAIADTVSATIAYEGLLAEAAQSSTVKGILRAAF